MALQRRPDAPRKRKPSRSSKWDDLLREAREQYDLGINADRENMDEALLDARMYASDQWPEEVLRARSDPENYRPSLTINRIQQFVNGIIGDIRLNPPAIKVRPVDGNTDVRLAEVMNGLIRDIEAQSRATQAYITASENAAIGGIGHWRICTEYATDDGWDQDIRIRRIASPFAVVWDPGAHELTREDASWCFVTEQLTLSEFEKRYPGAVPDSWEDYARIYPRWCDGQFVTVAEYWWREPTKKTLHRLIDGTTIDAESIEPEQLAAIEAAGAIAATRVVDTCRIRQCVLSASEVLEEPQDWDGKYIPIVTVVGREINVGDKIVRHGMVRLLRDPQRMYNYHVSAYVEATSLAPKAKWIGTAKHFEGLEGYWQQANTGNFPYLVYNPDQQAPAGPQRVAPEIPAEALLREVQIAAQDMEAVTGIYRPNLGAPSNETSGKAIRARQSEGDASTYLYRDNLEQAVAHCGRILIDLIPRIYDTPRVVRVLGEDGAEDFVQINVPGPDGRKLYDLSAGKYDIVASVGPSYTTKREEMRDSMAMVLQAMPVLAQAAPDLFIEAQDWPGGDKIVARLRKMLPPGLAEPEPGEPPPAPPQPSPEVIAAQANMTLAQAEIIKAQAAMQKAAADAEAKRAELEIERIKAAMAGVKIDGELQLKAGDQLIKAAKADADITHQRAKQALDGVRMIADQTNRNRDRQERAANGIMGGNRPDRRTGRRQPPG